jgi:heme/copper-type cytochrome/quinol oxidase subunit 2
MVKFRARKGQTAAQIHGNTRLEIGWTVGAFLILVFITVFTFITLPGIKNPAPPTSTPTATRSRPPTRSTRPRISRHRRRAARA